MPETDHRRKTVRRSGGHGRPSSSDPLLRVIDGGLVACIFLVPLLMGGRQAMGQLVLVTLATGLGLAWMVRQILSGNSVWRRSSADLLLLAGLVLLALQLVSLSPCWLARLSPHAARLLPLWSEASDPSLRVGTWTCISLTPAATQSALGIFAAYGILFVVTVQRVGDAGDIERLLRWIGWSVALMAAFGVVQLVTSNGKFFWFYEHPFTTTHGAAKGSFTNRNHFAQFLALGIGPLIWWLQHQPARGRHRQEAFGSLEDSARALASGIGLRSAVLGVVLFAGLLSLSRGGAMAILLAAAIAGVICVRMQRLGGHFLLGLSGAAVLIVSLLAIHGYDRVSDRLDDFGAGSLEDLDQQAGRRTIWATVARAIPDFALLGSGVGSHREIYPAYLDGPLPLEFTHAENSPLQVALETGVAGLTLVLAGVACCGFWCLAGLRRAQSSRLLVCVAAVSASLAANLVHALVDFVWYVPGCMVLVAILAGCACRLWQLSGVSAGDAASISLPKFVLPAIAAMVLAAGGWMFAAGLGPALAESHWDRYLIMNLASSMPRRLPQEEAEEQPSAARRPDAAPSTAPPASMWNSTPPPGLPVPSVMPWLSASPPGLPWPGGMPPPPVAPGTMPPDMALPDFLRNTVPPNFLPGPPPAPSGVAGATGTACSRPPSPSPLGGAISPTAVFGRPAQDSAIEIVTKMIDELEQVVAWDPRHARARLRLAATYLRRFELMQQAAENAMGLSQIRDAALVAKFPTREALREWLGRAVGARAADLDLAMAHTREALALCPLQGKGYLYLAELQFLDDPSCGRARGAYLQQATIVRPWDGDVLLAAGREAWVSGDYPQGIESWRKAFQCGRPYQEELARLLAGHVPVAFLLENFHPDLEALRILAAAYARLGQADALAEVCQSAAQLLANGAVDIEPKKAAWVWLEIGEMYERLNEAERSVACAENAFRCDPNNEAVRYVLAKRLVRQAQYDRAEQHLRWCLQRRPNDQRLSRLAQQLVRLRVQGQGRLVYSNGVLLRY